MIGLFGSCKARPNISEELAGQIEFVCSDMWQPYLTVIRERCGQAIHILDRFHIVAKMNTALDQVRAGEARTLARDGYEPVLRVRPETL
jgi:transposase